MTTYKDMVVLVLGLSVEGKDTVRFLVSEGARVICADRRTKEALGSTFDDLVQFPVTFDLGEEQFRHIYDVSMIVRSPGIALNTPELQEARKRGIEITSQTKLFFNHAPCPIIGVTGTKGKGTTSTLIYDMVKASGKTAWLGGNVGTPLLSRVREMTKDDWVILELSSFQLEDCTKSPHIAVVLRTTQDHLANYDTLASNYHPSRAAYVDAKRHIVQYQRPTDIVIVNTDDDTARSFLHDTPAKPYRFSRYTPCDAYVSDHTVFLTIDKAKQPIGSRQDIALRGEHNLENIAAASLAAYHAGVPFEIIQKVARTFKGLPYRLEEVGNVGGVLFINDSFSTVPETTVAAIQSFEQPIILIVGGSEKGSDFTDMGAMIAKSTVKEILIIGDMTERILAALKKASYSGVIVTGLESMHAVITRAYADAQPGDVVLLSPGCASFGMFKNYKDRGNQFTYEVSTLSS